MVGCTCNYDRTKENAVDICSAIGNSDVLAGEGLLVNLCAFLRAARMKHSYNKQTRQKLFEAFLKEVEELKNAYDNKHEHSFESEIMDCMTVLVRLWNGEYNKEMGKAEGHEWVRETQM